MHSEAINKFFFNTNKTKMLWNINFQEYIPQYPLL